jgi:hypothetical protein
MTWLTWRQHRLQALLLLLGLLALAALMIPTGRDMHQALVAHGLSDCLKSVGRSDPACDELARAFSDRFSRLELVGVLFLFVPLIIGLFVGAPLVAREVEHGTHRLVWTQGVTRLRWALVKIGLVGAMAVALAAGYALLLSWWITPLNRINGTRFDPGLFDLQGMVPIGYTVFAVALGTLAGTITRKVLPAMALTVFGFVGARLAVAFLARPHFLPPLHRDLPVVGGETFLRHANWVLHLTGLYDSAGHQIGHGAPSFCASGAAAGPCNEKFGIGAYNLLVYQPAGRFWTFQAIETGFFIALAALLLAVAVHRIRRRLS